MPNEISPTLPFTEIAIGGKSYRMCFDYDSLAEAETKLLTKGIDVNLNFCLPSLNFSSTRIIFACSLFAYQPETDYKAALALVTRDNNIDILSAIIKAWNLSVPESEEKKDETVDPPQPEA